MSMVLWAAATAPTRWVGAQDGNAATGVPASAPAGGGESGNTSPRVPAETPNGTAATDADASAARTPAQRRRAARRAKRRAQRESRRRARAQRRAANRRRMASYRVMRKRWHQKAPVGMVRAWQQQSPHPLVLRPVGDEDEFTLVPDEAGRFLDRVSQRKVRRAFRHRSGKSTNIHPRVLELIYRAVKAFDAPWVVLVSGYRPGRATSRHTMGRAADVVLPGVSDSRLARFFRQQGFAGVGQYPLSGFVHIDVREKSYFWVDRSMPGGRGRRRPILRDATFKADRDARARGEEQVMAPGARSRGGADEADDETEGDEENEAVDEPDAEGIAPTSNESAAP